MAERKPYGWIRRNWLVLLIGAGVLAYTVGGRQLKRPSEPPMLNLAVPAGPAYLADGTVIEPEIGMPTDRPRVVDFYTDQCPACRTIRPAMDELAKECGAVEVVMVNLSDRRNEHLATRYGLLGVPTISLLDAAGEETGRMVGIVGSGALRRAAGNLAGTPCSR